MAIRWLEAHVKEKNRQEANNIKHLAEFDCPKDLDPCKTIGKILNIPLEDD